MVQQRCHHLAVPQSGVYRRQSGLLCAAGTGMLWDPDDGVGVWSDKPQRPGRWAEVLQWCVACHGSLTPENRETGPSAAKQGGLQGTKTTRQHRATVCFTCKCAMHCGYHQPSPFLRLLGQEVLHPPLCQHPIG